MHPASATRSVSAATTAGDAVIRSESDCKSALAALPTVQAPLAPPATFVHQLSAVCELFRPSCTLRSAGIPRYQQYAGAATTTRDRDYDEASALATYVHRGRHLQPPSIHFLACHPLTARRSSGRRGPPCFAVGSPTISATCADALPWWTKQRRVIVVARTTTNQVLSAARFLG
jgi:hypothetical protein